MSLNSFNEALQKAKRVLRKESASTVDELTRQHNHDTVRYTVTNAASKLGQIENLVFTKFSPNAKVSLEGDTIVVEGPHKKSLEVLLKKFGTVTIG